MLLVNVFVTQMHIWCNGSNGAMFVFDLCMHLFYSLWNFNNWIYGW